MHNNHYIRDEQDFKNFKYNMRAQKILAATGACVLLITILVFTLWTPITGPWVQERQGIANLRQAAQERQILVAEAQGELDAAMNQAEAIKTMGQAARDFPEYRTQMFIEAFAEALANGTISEIVYVPTETSLPITEAGKR